VLVRLAEWRQSVAFEADESPAFVCPSALLCQIALAAVPAPCSAPATQSAVAPAARLESPVDLLRLQSPLPPFLFLPFASCSPSPPGSPGLHGNPSYSSMTSSASGGSLSSEQSPLVGEEQQQQLVGGGALGVLMVVRDARREFAEQLEQEQQKARELQLEQKKVDEQQRRREAAWSPSQDLQRNQESGESRQGEPEQEQRGGQLEEHGGSWTATPRRSTGTVLPGGGSSWLSFWRTGCWALLGELGGGDLTSLFFSPSTLLSVGALLLLARLRGRVNVHRGGDAS